jgi:hypothetical protein
VRTSTIPLYLTIAERVQYAFIICFMNRLDAIRTMLSRASRTFMLASVAYAIGVQSIWNLNTRSMVLMCMLSYRACTLTHSAKLRQHMQFAWEHEAMTLEQATPANRAVSEQGNCQISTDTDTCHTRALFKTKRCSGQPTNPFHYRRTHLVGKSDARIPPSTRPGTVGNSCDGKPRS